VLLIVYVLVGADSSTGDLTLVALVVTTLLMVAYGPLSRSVLDTAGRRIGALVGTVVAVAAACWVLGAALGQDLLTFSDRTPLWSAAISVAQERPWGGYGYGAVWQHPWKPPLLNIVIGEIWDRSGDALSHGHNSAVDLVVEVGVVGVLLMVVVMLTAALRAIASVRVGGSARDLVRFRFTVLCLVNLVLFGITEPMATIPLGWWALVLLTEPLRRTRRTGRRAKPRVWMPPGPATTDEGRPRTSR
jgi:O-antigen ligase